LTFDALFVPAPLREAVSDAAWLSAMLDVERALANALSRAGVIPPEAAAAIADACDPAAYDIGVLSAEGRATANPAAPLVAALRTQVGGSHARYVHYGATSQDVLDTAAMLVSRHALELLDSELAGAASAAAALAERYRATPVAGRTLLQQAVPTTFGLKASGWLLLLVEARERLARLRLPAQLGGAAGTLAPLGPLGVEVLRLFADEVGLREPVLPWHASRGPIADLAGALGSAARAASKIGLDVVLLAQTEVGEVSERESGGSSTMPHKRNPVRAVLARACARGVYAQVALLASGEHEHERAAGAWQAEWTALSSALASTGGAVTAARECLESLDVHVERMRANMTDDLLAERRSFVGEAADADPATYLGSAETFVDRALARHRESR
jgi:3-carboxy-cis,cis-muconate cycloisomerase